MLKRIFFVAALALLILSCENSNESINTVTVFVESENDLLPNVKVELYKLSKGGTSSLIEESVTNDQGMVVFIQPDDAAFLYAIAYPNNDQNEVQLMSVVDNDDQVTVNELTTVASAAVYANFIKKGRLKGKQRVILMGKHSVANLVNPSNGNYGKTLLTGDNLTESTTVGKLNTLANILNAAISSEEVYYDWKIAALTTAEQSETMSTIELLARMFQHSWFQPNKQFDLFTELYPRGKELRATPFVPYLEMSPNEFALAVRFSGGGIYSPGKLEMDKKGNIWTGNNWMPGSQSNTLRGIGGGMTKLSPSGKALSPDITGFVGPGVNGCGWGTAVGEKQVWMTSFNGKIAVYNHKGKAVEAKVNGKVGNCMGVAISPVNDDVWVCDGSANQMIVFRGGDPSAGEVVKVPNLASPFSVVVDENNDVWVGNSAGYFITKFNAENPEKAKKYMTDGISIRGISLDENGNLWVSNSFNMDTKVPKVDPTFTIMQQFTFLGKFAYENYPPNTTETVGSLTLLNGEDPSEILMHISGESSQLCGPWGNVVDGANNVWAGNFLATGVVNYTTVDQPEFGLKKGDLIHKYQMGLFQEVTDVLVDYLGHVWVANNWNDEETVLGLKNDQASSTKGGGAGVTIIYGAARPV